MFSSNQWWFFFYFIWCRLKDEKLDGLPALRNNLRRDMAIFVKYVSKHRQPQFYFLVDIFAVSFIPLYCSRHTFFLSQLNTNHFWGVFLFVLLSYVLVYITLFSPSSIFVDVIILNAKTQISVCCLSQHDHDVIDTGHFFLWLNCIPIFFIFYWWTWLNT